jgi:hypothetical protein
LNFKYRAEAIIDRRAISLIKNSRDVLMMLKDVPLLTFIKSVPGLQSRVFVGWKAQVVHYGVLNSILSFMGCKEAAFVVCKGNLNKH